MLNFRRAFVHILHSCLMGPAGARTNFQFVLISEDNRFAIERPPEIENVISIGV